jgi:[glutamine synthetase] adenylyltransferase / [glutamine synthetase]-adenylyl-L-tyrosine phosphorylase
MLVASLEGYRNYQLEHAWTWEHQALVRARLIAGSAEVGATFAALRREVLCRPQDPGRLRMEIRAMRQKMYDNLGDHRPGRFDLKHGRGGVTDIEFMVQYAVLRDAARRPELVQYTDNIRQIDALYAAGILSEVQATLLADAYRAYRKRIHALTLQELPAVVSEAEFAEYRSGVTQLWRTLMEEA